LFRKGSHESSRFRLALISAIAGIAAEFPWVSSAGCVLSRPKFCLNRKPHAWFNLRDERIWRVTAYAEDEIGGLDTLAVGDALSVVGALDVHAAEESQGRKRIAYCVTARQLLLLRSRSPAKASASSFFAVKDSAEGLAPGRGQIPSMLGI
jgi:hypothetical protein